MRQLLPRRLAVLSAAAVCAALVGGLGATASAGQPGATDAEVVPAQFEVRPQVDRRRYIGPEGRPLDVYRYDPRRDRRFAVTGQPFRVYAGYGSLPRGWRFGDTTRLTLSEALRFDRDRDGLLDRREQLALMRYRRALRDRYDFTGDGRLSVREQRILSADLDDPLTRRERRLLRQYQHHWRAFGADDFVSPGFRFELGF